MKCIFIMLFFMSTNVYHYRSTIIKLQCEGTRRVLYDGFSTKITHEKKIIIYLKNILETSP